jgi:hypothetical protein
MSIHFARTPSLNYSLASSRVGHHAKEVVMPASRQTQSIGGRLGVQRKLHPGTDTTELERSLACSKIEDRVRDILKTAPPLTDVQRQRISALLQDGE